MLRWFRARVRPVAAAALVSFIAVGGLSSAWHGAECHEDECGIVLPHDPDSHRVRSTASELDSHPLHCVLCHWTRSTRPSPEPVHHFGPAAQQDEAIHVDVEVAIASVRVPQPPLRSPPVAPAHTV